MRTLSAFLLLTLLSSASAQPLIEPFDFVMPSWDSTRSAWLPEMPAEDIDAMGFLRTGADGHLVWENGARARFFGTSVISSACFPDSVAALVTAKRLRKLGINMVRFSYFDYHNSNGSSTLAPGNRSDTLSAPQMKRLDWFLHQLKLNGIRAHFVLKSRNGPRRDDGVPGWDSAYSSGQYLSLFSAPMQAMQRRYMTQLFNHTNPYTGLRYADDPVIALVTITDQNTLYDHWINDRLNVRANTISFHHSRLLDTLFADYLKRKFYNSTEALKNAFREGIAGVGPNIIVNPGFEAFTDNWTLQVGEGAQANAVIVQGTDVPPGEGTYALRVAVRASNGNENRIYLEQRGTPVRKYGIYRLRFKAKTDLEAGRQIRIALFRGVAPSDNFGLNETVNLTTSWQTFDYTFRSSASDTLSTIFRIYIGRSMGDLFLDGFSLQETGREGLADGETLENATVLRAKFRDLPKMSLQRIYSQTDFYDSLSRAYYRGMHDHLRTIGVRAPIAGTNSTSASADTWVQSEFDFTSETAQWDFNGSRAGDIPYSDSTWVIRNYSVLRYRDQKIPEFSRNAIAGKPFIAESYLHIFPNAHRPEMMLFLPAYASLHDWDGAYLYSYSDRNSEMADRRRVFKDDFTSIIADPSICALMPQVSATLRNGWIAPAARTIRFQHDENDLRSLPLTYSSRGTYHIDGSFNNVMNLVSAIRIDSFAASRHYRADDYYVTIPSDDNIESDTRQIRLDMTKGIMQVSTPNFQGGSGALHTASMVRTDDLGVSWIDGARHITYIWSTLDDRPLDSARRSLLTVTTRSLNSGAIWQFGDSSLGRNWGAAPMQMESARIGVNFYTSADSLLLHPLDSLAQPMGRTIPATRATSGSWRVTLDLATERTPWFGVEQIFNGTSSVAAGAQVTAMVSEGYPNPAGDIVTFGVSVPEDGTIVAAQLSDLLGSIVATVPEHSARQGRSTLQIALRDLPNGVYICAIRIGERNFTRRIVVFSRFTFNDLRWQRAPRGGARLQSSFG